MSAVHFENVKDIRTCMTCLTCLIDICKNQSEDEIKSTETQETQIAKYVSLLVKQWNYSLVLQEHLVVLIEIPERLLVKLKDAIQNSKTAKRIILEVYPTIDSYLPYSLPDRPKDLFITTISMKKFRGYWSSGADSRIVLDESLNKHWIPDMVIHRGPDTLAYLLWLSSPDLDDYGRDMNFTNLVDSVANFSEPVNEDNWAIFKYDPKKGPYSYIGLLGRI